MNLLLFSATELDQSGTLRIGDRRLTHLRTVLKSTVGDVVRVGEIGGNVGFGVVSHIDTKVATLTITLDATPPPALPLTVVLALPRPKMLRRILRALGEVGVKELHLINSYRVEKSFWQSPLLSPERLRSHLLDGLEQAQDTVVPAVVLHRRFRPFAEDLLPSLVRGRSALLADPSSGTPFPNTPLLPALLVIGPEGGFIPFEVEKLNHAGCEAVSLGPRILRVETALQCSLGRFLAAA